MVSVKNFWTSDLDSLLWMHAFFCALCPASNSFSHGQSRLKSLNGIDMNLPFTGGDLGEDGGMVPKIWGWGMAHASVPQYFGEVLFLEVRQSRNLLKKGLKEEIYGQEKGSYSVIYQISDSKDKKVIRNYRRWNANFFLKKVTHKFLLRNFYPFPQSRRQDSAHAHMMHLQCVNINTSIAD